MRQRVASRKSVYGSRRFWHLRTTEAAEQGGNERLAAARAAVPAHQGGIIFCPDVRFGCLRHSGAADGGPVPQSPLPASSEFGILPYAAWHGHLEVVRDFIERRASLHATAQVETVPYSRRWVEEALGLSILAIPYTDGPMADWRDAAMVQLLLEKGVRLEHPFLLDVIRPRPGSLFATKAGSWRQEFHRYCPPAFKAAAAELLRISHKHGRSVCGGRLVWPFRCDELNKPLLPVLGQDMAPWLQEGYMEDDQADTSEEED
ncbi:hypothetical protein ABPG75_003026 [Micractinium tetrahymenae]